MKEYHVTGFARKYINETVKADSEEEALESFDDYECDDLEVNEIQEDY